MNKTPLYLLSFCFLLLGAQSVPAQNLEPKIDQILREVFPDAEGPGGTALLVKDGEVLYHKAFGLANLELDVAMRPDYIFRIGSITKQFTASAILKLMEEGKLSLQDDITKFIEDYPTHGHTITVEHLLTHTSGIRSYTGLPKWTAEERKRDFTPKEMVDYFKNEPMDFAPGEQYRYNNSAYFLLGYIIEIVSGKTYAEYIHEHFFEPLGMEHSFYGNTSRIIEGRAAGYQQTNDQYKNADFLSMTQPYAAGSLLSNVTDLYTWYGAVMEGKVLSEESLAKAHATYHLNSGKPTGYGYGWGVGNVRGSPSISHGGGINGYLTASIYLPEEKVFAAVFSNCNCHPPGPSAAKIAALAIGKPFEWERIDMAAHILKFYEGVYESEYGDQQIITFEDGQLYAMRSGGAKSPVFPYGKDKFVFEDNLVTLTFNRNRRGAIGSVTIHSLGLPTTWNRTDKEIPRRESIELEAEMLDKYVGNYQLSADFKVRIFRKGEKLFAQPTGQERAEMLAEAPHKFFLKTEDVRIHFHLDDAGEVTGLTILQGGEEYKAEKVE